MDFGFKNYSEFRVQSAAVAERFMHFAVDEDDDGSSPFGRANIN